MELAHRFAPRSDHDPRHRSRVAACCRNSGHHRRNSVKPMRKLALASAILIALIIAVAAGFWQRPLGYFNGLTYVQMTLGGAKSRYITVNGHRIHYYVAG